MKLNKQQIGVLAVLFIFLTLRFIATPILDRQQPLKIVKKILKIWESSDVTEAYQYWQKIDEVPPIDNLKNYNILSNKFYKDKGVKKDDIIVSLEFANHPIMPPKSTWIISMEKTFNGWQVTKFQQYIPDKKTDNK